MAEKTPRVVPAELRPEEPLAEPRPDPRHEPRVGAKALLAVLSTMLVYFAQMLSIVGAGSQGQAIAARFGAPQDSVWMSGPIAILTVVAGLPVSQAADYWGRKWFIVVCCVSGVVGGVVVARAQSVAAAIAGFCVIGAAFGAQPLLHTVPSEVLPRRFRSFAQASDQVSSAGGSITGLLVGGALARHGSLDSFRPYFYMVTGVYALAALLNAVAYRPPRRARQALPTRQKLARLDWLGFVLLAGFLVLFSVGLSWSQNPFPWCDAHVSATFAVGVALGIALVLHEMRVADGMFHHGLFGRRNFPIALFCIFCEGLAFFAANSYFVFEVGTLYEPDKLITGLRYSIMQMAEAISSTLTGLYCSLTRRPKHAAFTAFVAFTVFFICMSTATLGSNTAVWVYPAILGIGLGMSLNSLVTIAQLSTPRTLISPASGLMIGMRSLGGSIGIAIYNAIFVSKMRRLSSNVGAAATAAGLPAGNVTAFVAAVKAKNATVLAAAGASVVAAGEEAYKQTYLESFRYVWVCAACFVFVAVIATLFFQDTRKEFNMHIDAPMNKEFTEDDGL